MSQFWRYNILVFLTLIIILSSALIVNAQVPSNVDTLKLENGSGNPGEVVVVGVHLINTFAVGGFSTRIVFNQNVLSVHSLELAERTSNMEIFAIDTSDTGVLQVSGAYLQPRVNYLLPGAGEIYYINFRIDDFADSGVYALDFQNSGYHTYENHLSDTTGLQLILPVLVDGEIEVDVPVFVDHEAIIPEAISVIYNYPNPFNNRTSFLLSLANKGAVTFQIFNIMGQEVRFFEMGVLTPGEYKFEWDGRNNYGKEVASGVYSYALYVDNMSVITNKMILLK